MMFEPKRVVLPRFQIRLPILCQLAQPSASNIRGQNAFRVYGRITKSIISAYFMFAYGIIVVADR